MLTFIDYTESQMRVQPTKVDVSRWFLGVSSLRKKWLILVSLDSYIGVQLDTKMSRSTRNVCPADSDPRWLKNVDRPTYWCQATNLLVSSDLPNGVQWPHYLGQATPLHASIFQLIGVARLNYAGRLTQLLVSIDPYTCVIALLDKCIGVGWRTIWVKWH